MKILLCNCVNKFQDEKYGKFRRACNIVNKTPGMYRCTVCGKEKKV